MVVSGLHSFAKIVAPIWKFKGQKFGKGYLGVNIWSRDFLGLLLLTLRIFLVPDFCPHLIIPVT